MVHGEAYHIPQGPVGYPTRTLQQLQDSPSRADGLAAEQERAMLRTCIYMIIGAGQKLQMDHLAISTAVVYLQRFYAIKSLLRNDYFVLGIACLYLGGKVEDSPKSVRDVLYACFEWRFKGQQDVLRRLYDKEFYESARERVFTAERALMYALGFDFNVGHPFEPLIGMFKDPASPVAQLRDQILATDPSKAQSIGQVSLSMANDSLKTPLCLQYGPQQVAAAVVWLVLSMYRLDADTLDSHGRVWWTAYGLTPHALEDITQQLLELYQPEVLQPAAGAAEEAAQQYGTAQQVVQGVMDGQLLLYATNTQRAEAARAAAQPAQQPPQQQQQQQQQPQQEPATAAAVPAEPAATPAAPAPVAPPPQEQPASQPQKEGVDGLDEYDELFA